MPRPNPQTGQQKWRRWTNDEWAIINHSLDHGIQARELLPQLPGRSLTDIFNARNIAKRKKLALCEGGCGRPKPDPDTRLCEHCHDRVTQRRLQALADGCCASCNRPLDTDPNASGTVCGSCRERRKKYQGHRPANPANNRPTQYRVLPWPRAGSLYWMVEQLTTHARTRPAPDWHFLDLFGGTGQACIEITKRIGTRVTCHYNDIHPGLTALIAQARTRPDALWNLYERLRADFDDQERLTAYQTLLDPSRDPGLRAEIDATVAAALTLDHHATPDKTTLIAAAHNLRGALHDISNRDWLDALATIPRNQKTLIFADPPWPGLEDTYEFGYTMSAPGRFEHLIRTLDALPAHCPWILSLGAERIALETLARALPQPWRTSPTTTRAFWRQTVAFRREILVTSNNLAVPVTTKGIFPIDPEALGLKPTTRSS